MKNLTCYGDTYATTDADSAAELAGEHIRACPRGAMPWATEVEWHQASRGTLVSAAGGQWLDHWIVEPS